MEQVGGAMNKQTDRDDKRIEVLQRVHFGCERLTNVARELDVPYTTASRWVREFEEEKGRPDRQTLEAIMARYHPDVFRDMEGGRLTWSKRLPLLLQLDTERQTMNEAQTLEIRSLRKRVGELQESVKEAREATAREFQYMERIESYYDSMVKERDALQAENANLKARLKSLGGPLA